MIAAPPPAGLRRRSGRKWRRYPAGVIAAWIADMDFYPAPPISRCLEQAIALGDFGYGPTAAASGVAEAFSRWAARRWDWAPDPANILLMPDVVGGVANCIEALTGPGDAILVQTPAYPPLLSSVEVAGRVLVEHPLADNGIDFADLDIVLQRERVRMLLFCHPHNPTGRVFGDDELKQLAALAIAHDIIVVADEVHADLTFPGRRHLPFAACAPGRTVTLNSPSKAFNVAGLRTAVCVAPPHLRVRLASLPPTRWNAFSTLGVRAALAAWSDEGEQWLCDCLLHLREMRDHLSRRLAADFPAIGFTPPQAGYLAWLDCRALGIVDPAAFFLDQARVALSPGHEFGTPGAGFARLNFATSREILEAMLDRMARALA